MSAALSEAEPPERPRLPESVPEALPDLGFEQIFVRECSYVWASLRRLGVAERDLEDLTHDVFLVLHRHLDKFDPSRPLRPFLFGICYRVASTYRRLARHQREVLGDETELVDESPGADDRLVELEDRNLASQALATLDLDRRAVFLMHAYDGMTMPQIAEALGIPLNTAYSRLRLAREHFVRTIERLRARRATVPADSSEQGRSTRGKR